MLVWARSTALCGDFWKKCFLANLCHFFVRKSHFWPKTAAKCQKWIFFKSPTQRSRTCSFCLICELAFKSEHFKDTKTQYNFFLSHSESVFKIKLFSCWPRRAMKSTWKMMIKEHLLLGNIYFWYDKRNQYRSTSGNLTMYVKLMRTWSGVLKIPLEMHRCGHLPHVHVMMRFFQAAKPSKERMSFNIAAFPAFCN